MKQILGIYKLIILLNIINKIIETTIYRCFLDIIEKYRFFSEKQIDNKIIRLIELTIRIVIEMIYMI